jgi:hypothetical protein
VQNILILELILFSHISKKSTASIFIVVQVAMDYSENGGFLKTLVPMHQSVCLFCPRRWKSFFSTAVCENEFLMHCLLSKVYSVGLCGGGVLSEGQRVMK